MTAAPAVFSLLVALSAAPSAQEAYRLPPPEVVELVDAPATPSVQVSPDARWMLISERGALPAIADVARPWLPLAGLRVDPTANAGYRTGFDLGLLLREVQGGAEYRIPLADGARLMSARWSHTSRALAYTLRADDGVELWVAQVDAPDAPVKVTDRLNAVFGNGFRWMPDGARLLVHLVPSGRGAAPERPAVPAGPITQETSGDASPLRTYQDLLDDEHDAQLFEHYGVTQLAVWTPGDGKLAPVGRPGIVMSATPSPDGENLLVSEIHRPFSYLMPYYSFPQRIEVRDLNGGTRHLLADVPLAESIPIGGVRTGPRMARWKAGEPATLVWAEALDGGDPKAEVEHRDRWLSLPAPFDGAPRELARVAQRATGLTWMEDPGLAVFSEYDRDRRWTHSAIVDLKDPSAERRVLEDRSVRDRYGDPGDPVLRYDGRGSLVVRQDGGWIYRSGYGAADGGARPFLDRVELATLGVERLWRCAPGCYESVVALVRGGTERKPSFVTRYESPAEPPNWRLRDLEDAAKVARLTDYPDPQPSLRGVKKELITYERADGVPLSATLYLPAGYEEGTRLPLFVWAYPREFNDPSTAGQVSGTPYRFTRFASYSHLFLLTQGYAVLDNAAMPVIGDAETMNDTFVEQITMAAEAAIRVADEMGVADPARAAVGGHSYGAFMTANLLAHTDLFRAGIARSGAYNRTLTPFGFQAERRTVWEATDTYVSVSPFLHADGMGEPLLLIHGAVDNNSGTFPMQSERLYQAIKGLGGTARHVVLPHESHGYRARESVLHVLAEMIDWLDRHMAAGGVLEAGATGPEAAADEAAAPANR
ncbi:MAG: prolyl oligopeptidase family serine peptidase [Planctomycetota bacterium]